MNKPSVLIIDDDQWLAGVVSRMLEKAGYAVNIIANALDGMEFIDKLHPDVIILDIFMPGPNGIVLLHEIRSHSDLVHIPIIICTNSAADIPRGDLSHYGVTTILDKTSMHPEDVVVAVKKVLL